MKVSPVTFWGSGIKRAQRQHLLCKDKFPLHLLWESKLDLFLEEKGKGMTSVLWKFRAQVAYLKGANISPETLPQTVIPHMLSTPWVGMAVITHLFSSSWVSWHPSTKQNSLGLRLRFIQSFLIGCYPLPPPGLKLGLDLWSACLSISGQRWQIWRSLSTFLGNTNLAISTMDTEAPHPCSQLGNGVGSLVEGREGIVIILNATLLPHPSQEKCQRCCSCSQRDTVVSTDFRPFCTAPGPECRISVTDETQTLLYSSPGKPSSHS